MYPIYFSDTTIGNGLMTIINADRSCSLFDIRFLTTFRYIEEQKNNALTAQASDVLKNYHWPTSFSHCTAGLRT